MPRLPGRGLTSDKLHYLTALPRIDGVEDAEDLADGIAALVSAVQDSWQGPAHRPSACCLLVPGTVVEPMGSGRPSDALRLLRRTSGPPHAIWNGVACHDPACRGRRSGRWPRPNRSDPAAEDVRRSGGSRLPHGGAPPSIRSWSQTGQVLIVASLVLMVGRSAPAVRRGQVSRGEQRTGLSGGQLPRG